MAEVFVCPKGQLSAASRRELRRLTTSRPSWVERIWYRRLGETVPDATASSGPWHAHLIRLLPYRWRRLHWLYAFWYGYFWLPCPLCYRPFGGHEHGASIPHPLKGRMSGIVICSRCTIERNRGNDG